MKINDMIRFFVSDTGIGINESHYKNLFNLYVKNSEENNKLGSGLGLSIVNDITKKLGSEIHFESIEGVGTKFWFDLPIIHTVKRISQSSKSLCEYKFNNSNLSNNETVILQDYNINIPESYLLSTRVDSDKIIKMQLHNYNINNNIIINSPKVDKFPSKDSINIIVADDESIVRQSTIRILKKVADEMNTNINFIESEDGIETLYVFYKYISLGISISGIISDESMNLMNGTYCGEVISCILQKRGMQAIQYLIVTAYENSMKINSHIVHIETKPLDKNNARKILCCCLK
jgi:hypothetical protein